MNNTNVILSKVSRLEELPNELFLLIFSYLKSNMVIQTFLNLNQRFQSLILQFTRHLVLSNDTESNWIKKYMVLIKNEIETITLSIELILSVFSGKYSYPNLHSITMYLNIKWQIELNIENQSPMDAIVSALNVLKTCSFERVKRDYSNTLIPDYMTPAINGTQTTKKNVPNNNILPCSAIRGIWILECDERNLWKLCHLAPELTYLKIWLRSSSTLNYSLAATPARITPPTRLTELYIKVIDLQSFKDVRLLIGHCQAFLRRITLDLGRDLMIDGRNLEALLKSCKSLEDLSFISRFSKKQSNISNLLCSFQSEWWLDSRRPSVLIHKANVDNILVVSIPCSFSNILKHFQFSSDLNSWHLNKGKLDSLLIGSLKTNKICFSSKQPISLDFLQFAAHIFYSQKQILACQFWGLKFEQKMFEQFMNKSIVKIILPNVARFKITHVNGLSPMTLAVWILLAPNVRMLEIEYLTFSEVMEWITELEDAIVMNDQRLKMIFQRIQRIIISSVSYNCHDKSKLKICTILNKIFSTAMIC